MTDILLLFASFIILLIVIIDIEKNKKYRRITIAIVLLMTMDQFKYFVVEQPTSFVNMVCLILCGYIIGLFYKYRNNIM